MDMGMGGQPSSINNVGYLARGDGGGGRGEGGRAEVVSRSTLAQ